MERERLEHEIDQLAKIIAADGFALGRPSTPIADRARLRNQIDLRTAMWAGLLKQLSGSPSLGAAEPRAPQCASQSIFTRRS
jgi:hypothetical protein